MTQRKPSLQDYIADRAGSVRGGTEEATRYAFGGDLEMLRQLKRFRPLELVIESLVRASKSMMHSQYLGTTIRVSERQVPRIYALAKECARELGVPIPTVYVANSPFMNAFTYGTEEESFIVLHSKLVDDFDDEELRFVIGHETGHIQNKHVVYMTALRVLTAGTSLPMTLLSPLIKSGLMAWSRRAEITCDRAGVLCTKDEKAAQRTFLKIACGSSSLYEQLDIDAYQEQLEDGQKGMGRFGELMLSHPYLTKRVEALRLFAETSLFREACGLEGGTSLRECDEKVADIIRVLKTN